jgi:hypothetical protein
MDCKNKIAEQLTRQLFSGQVIKKSGTGSVRTNIKSSPSAIPDPLHAIWCNSVSIRSGQAIRSILLTKEKRLC